jgi:hypothetical protein
MDSCPHESRCQWSLQHSNSGGSSQWSYPRGPISVLEGDSVELPICLRQGETKLQRRWMSMIRKNKSMLIDDYFDKI